MNRQPLPPFTAETAAQKVRLAEDLMEHVRSGPCGTCLFGPNSRWRNRAEFVQGREAVMAFLEMASRTGLPPHQEVRTFRDNRIAVRLLTNGMTTAVLGSQLRYRKLSRRASPDAFSGERRLSRQRCFATQPGR